MADAGLRRRGQVAPGDAIDSAASGVPSLKADSAPEPPPGAGPPGARNSDNSGGVAESASRAAEEKKKTRRSKKAAPPPLGFQEILSMGMTVVTLAVTVCSTYYILQQMKLKKSAKSSHTTWPTSASQTGSETLWTVEELSKYNGSDPKLPLLLGCVGEVFDVTKGSKHYGKGEGYNHFCGRDASRAFVSGNFSGDGLTDDLSRLTYDQLISVSGWRDFYHKTYTPVGKLVGRFYNSSGLPTKNLTRFERQLQRARDEKAKQEADDKKFVGCNSFWSSTEGGKVYCENGYPRMVFSVMQVGEGQSAERTKCICLDEEQIKGRADVQVYTDCDPWSTSCQVSPPENK